MKLKKAPLFSLYSEHLLKLMLMESQACMYLEGMVTLSTGPSVQRYMARMKLDIEEHQALIIQLLQVSDPVVWKCADRTEIEVARTIADLIDAINLSRLSNSGLINAAVRLQSYMLAEYQRAIALARFLGANSDVNRLSGICKAKRVRRSGLVALQLVHMAASPTYQPLARAR